MLKRKQDISSFIYFFFPFIFLIIIEGKFLKQSLSVIKDWKNASIGDMSELPHNYKMVNVSRQLLS